MEQFDIAKQTELLQKTTIKSIKGLFPIEGQNKTLHLLDVWADDRLDPNDFQSQFKAKIAERTWGVPIYGSFALVDNEGKVIQKKEKVRLVTLPKLTPRFSYIVGGSEYQIANQLRLRPAGYAVRTGPGGIKGQINLAKGYAGQIEMHAKPETGVFRLKVGQAYQRLYPILNVLGISDNELARSWGSDVLDANKAITQSEFDTSVRSFAKLMTRHNYTNTESAAEAIRKFVPETSMDPKVNKRTLGREHSTMDGAFLADMSKYILGVLRGEADPHDRNALEFKEYRQLADLIEERLSMREYKNKVVRTIRNNLNMPTREKVEDIVGATIINPHIEAVFSLPELHQLPKQLNPIDMFNTASMVTIMGPGGIREKHQITDDMRNLHPSHLGYLDPIHTPESAGVGVTYHLPTGVSAKEKILLTRVINVKSKKLERIGPDKFADSIIAFPGQLDAKGNWKTPKEVVVLHKGNVTKTVDSKEVDYILQSPKQVFSIASNLIPFLSTNSGGRNLIASKLAEQAVPLTEREEPLVQSKLGGKLTFERLMGDAFSTTSRVDGIVSKVTKDRIIIRDKQGKTHTYQVYDNFPLNFKSFVDSEILVKKGDIVKKGTLIADTNFTRNGVLALGKNLKTAYIPYKGYNFEDGIVITDTAAKKLTSEHLHRESVQSSDRFLIDKRQFIAHYPGSYTKTQVTKLDDNGVVKKGIVLQPGDPIVARLRKDEIDPEHIVFSKLSKTLIRPWKDDSIKWEGDVPGEVIDVQKHANNFKVYIKTKEPAQIGDKLVGRYGNKGIITLIIPESQAPQNKDGEPVDIMFNPHGIITRINIGQVLENAISKKAIAEGKPYVVDNFADKNYTNEVKSEIDKAGISDTEELFDPETNRSLGKVNVGNTYVLKLEKQVRSQFSARGAGPGWRYSQHTQEPVKGGEEGSKALDLLTFYSMLAHGARSNLREMASYKSTRNDDFWTALKTGTILPAPKPTFAYNKFISYLKGAGVDVKQEGSSLTLAPLTDKEIDKISNGPISNFQFVRAKDLAELKGGLMDKKVTGGIRGTQWSHINLSEPIVNPIFEQPVKTILKLKTKEFDDIVTGKTFIDGVTGGLAFKQMLKKVDTDKLMEEFVEQAKKSKSPDQLNKANRGIRYLESLKRFNLKPVDAYMLHKVPVLPPIFRPVYPLPNGNLHTSAVNFLYRDLGLVSEKLKFYNSLPYMPEDAKQAVRKDLYQGVAAIAGLANPITFYPPNRPVRGIIKEIAGIGSEGSKSGFFQRHVLRREQDLVGRGTIIPEPKLGIDEVGLPEEMAWTIFQPFVMRELINQGYRPADADQEITNRSFIAQKALDSVMNERPVMLNRAPSLHKFSIMAFKPKIVEGRAIKIPPLVVKGFNADFDGDAMHVHVPVLRKAVDEAKGMIPSKHIFNPGTGQIMISPSQESAIGLYFLTKDGTAVPQIFQSTKDMQEALEKKDITITDLVTVAGKRTTAGRVLVDSVLPKKYQGRNEILDKKGIRKLLVEISKNDPQLFSETVNKLTDLGNQYSFQRGFTVSLADLQPDLPEKDAILAEARNLSKGLDDESKIKLYQDVDIKIKSILNKRLGEQENNLYQMVASGSRGNIDQLKQIVSAPLLVEDVKGDTLPIPIDESFAKGLSLGQYWNSLYGSRRGVVDRQLQTSKPGEFNKDLMATVVRNVISGEDCKTSDGIEFETDDVDVQDRILADNIVVGDKVVAKAGDAITANMISNIRKTKVKKVKARSPITCKMPVGTCAKCYGLDADGRLPSIGDNIGAIAGQSMTEPLTQMTLSSMHHGGVVGAQKLTGYEKIDKLVKMPKVIIGKATLAEKDGKVTNIESAPAGGKNVFIGDVKHYISPGNPLKVRIGTKVKKGDSLSEGLIQPRELVELKGMRPAQQYIIDEITNAYRGTGVDLKKKNVETVVRSLTNTTRVIDGGDSPYLYGDIVPFNAAEAFNQSAAGKVPIEEAVGKLLFKDHGPVKAGTKIGKRVAKILANLGYSEAVIGPEPIVHEPFVDGVKQLPMMNRDWMSQMGYHHLARGIKEGAGETWTSELHDYAPVPAFAYGVEFGEGPEGKY